MNRTLYLHVGAPKCGSTTLQRALLCTPETRGVVAGYSVAAALQWAAGIYWKDQKPNDFDIKSWARRSADEDVIISAEAFFAHHARIAPLLLGELFPGRRVRTLVVWREAEALARSTLAQYVRLCQEVPSYMERLTHIRKIGLDAFAENIRDTHAGHSRAWTLLSDETLFGHVRGLSRIAADWQENAAFKAVVEATPRQNVSMPHDRALSLMERAETFEGTTEDWKALCNGI